jgi:hypothetical protein
MPTFSHWAISFQPESGSGTSPDAGGTPKGGQLACTVIHLEYERTALDNVRMTQAEGRKFASVQQDTVYTPAVRRVVGNLYLK